MVWVGEDSSSTLTLVEGVLVLLTLRATTGHAVQLVHEATATAGAFGLLVLTGGVVVGVVAATSEVVDEVHIDLLLGL